MKATNVCDVWNGVKGGGGGGWGMEAALKVAFFFLLPCVCVWQRKRTGRTNGKKAMGCPRQMDVCGGRAITNIANVLVIL